MRPLRNLAMKTMLAVGQLTATGDRAQNLRVCKDLAMQAKAKGASMLFLPECFSLVGVSWKETVSAGQSLDGPILQEMKDLAKDTKLWLSLGGFPEKRPDKEGEEEKVYNTHLILDDTGAIKAVYRKIHLFDVDVPNGPVLKESRYTAPGSEVVVCDSPCGRLGLSTCYDLRFPEIYAALVAKGAEIMLVPSAFTVPTGQAHWEVLLRARAIETQCYVVAAAQAGHHHEKRASYGHSLVVDPWGKVLADAGVDSPKLITAEMDLAYLHEIREKIPVQKHRRHDVFPSLQGGASSSAL